VFFGHQIQRYEIDARLAVGSSLAGHIAHRHYRGETYLLQLDHAHVRMIQGWDVHLISQLQQSKVAAVFAVHVSGVHDNFDLITHRALSIKGKARFVQYAVCTRSPATSTCTTGNTIRAHTV
jgi:hypothetical protein